MSEQFNKGVQGIKQFLSDIYAIDLDKNAKIISNKEKEMFAVEFDMENLSVSCLYTNGNATMIIKSKEILKTKKTEDLKEAEKSVKEILKQVDEKYGVQMIGDIDIGAGEFIINSKENKITYKLTLYGLYSNLNLIYSSNKDTAVLIKTTVKDITEFI